MKNLIKLLSLMTFTGLILASCEGPAGPAGKDGNNGLAGTDANETCKECHNPTVVDAIAVQYELSKHSYGEAAFEEAGNTSCAPCHESEGFKYVIKNNVSTVFTGTTTFTNPYVSSSSTAYGEISCFTCHSNLHTTFEGSDFSPLTTSAAVPMTMWGGAKTINLTQDGGMSNLCVRCHQPRPFTNSNTDKNVLNYAGLVSNPSATFYDAAQANTSNVLKPGYRTHTHYGTAGAIFAGQGGVAFSGPLSYSNSIHTTAASCQDCHMAPMTGAGGGHTFTAKGNFKGCTPCHPSVTESAQSDALWKTPRAEIKGLLEQLASNLKIGGIDILNRNSDSESNLWIGLTSNKYDGYLNIYDPRNNPDGGLYNTSMFQNPTQGSASSPWTQDEKDYNQTLPKIILTNAQMGAIINFQMCLRDYSLGIHNYNYTKALLTNSIAVTAPI